MQCQPATAAMLLLAATLPGGAAPEADQAPKEAPTRGVRVLGPAVRVDFDNRTLQIDAEVALTSGPLELFLCPKRTKEHESVLAADVAPRTVQLGLLMLGAAPGEPAGGAPATAPTGQPLRITCKFDREGKTESVDARSWIRQMGKNKPLESMFVFAGSRFVKPPGADRAVWLGDEGDLVCVSNFPGSVIDIAQLSSKDNAQLLFEAWTERIPPKGTKVRVIIEPVGKKP